MPPLAEAAWRKAGRVIGLLGLAALGAWLVYLFTHFVFRDPEGQRYQVESAALAFAICGLAVRLVRHEAFVSPDLPRARPVPAWAGLVAFAVVSVVLYWPSLSVGPLADDFVLIERARQWSVGPVSPILFRPVPLLVWAVILNLGGGAGWLHLLNVLLQGVNGWLASRVAHRWVQSETWSLAIGLVVLTFPLAPQAVAWCSGVFDLSAMLFVLLGVLIARKYSGSGTPVRYRILLIATGAAAFLSKETAAVTPLLVGLDAVLAGAWSQALAVDLVAMSAVVGGIGVARAFAVGLGLAGPALTRYVLQRALFGSFGALMVPWHDAVVQQHPLVPLVYGLVQVGLFSVFFVRASAAASTRIVVFGGAWILLSIAPLLPFFFVAGDLQSARYLYLGILGWSAILVTVMKDLSTFGPWGRRVSYAAALTMLLLGAYGARLHQRPWSEAAVLREAVMRSARDSSMRRCDRVTITEAPDQVDGALVFRNGLPEAFRRELGITASVSAAQQAGPCAFVWDAASRGFTVVR